ncbi:Protein TON_1965 [uncultured delta proteobacterium]|uniref:Protein TON_1965 n=1 Tax=uncultured delta proteobacterium TaxID=34034 RepID=A0A212K0E3_9DELT|nr:Protein TON_1965 [uncultured delta proteobacterium]
MDDGFEFSLSMEERQYLHDLVRSRIDLVLRDQKVGAMAPPPEGALHEKWGAFVTLKRNGQLRGCIGRIASNEPLHVTVGEMAEAAAFHDSRFPPLIMSEFKDLEVEVSVIGPITRCPDPRLVEVGRHGLVMRRESRQGLLLPQVPVEWEWDRETFLDQTCRKAGLPADAWHDPDTEIYWFEALIV